MSALGDMMKGGGNPLEAMMKGAGSRGGGRRKGRR